MGIQTYNVVAMGDSWFNYAPAFIPNPFAGDLIANLHKTGRLNIDNYSIAGDDLYNMAYGTDVTRDGEPKPCRLLKVLDAIRKNKPQAFLLSGGGNDFSGSNGVELEAFLNHAASGITPALRPEIVSANIQKFCPQAMRTIIIQVLAVDPNIKIFIAGYDYVRPDGRAVIDAPADFKFLGPWLAPAFERQRIWGPTEAFPQPEGARYEIMAQLIDALNKMIGDLNAEYPNSVFHVDLRGTLQLTEDDWANELHPSDAGWAKVAKVYAKRVLSVLDSFHP